MTWDERASDWAIDHTPIFGSVDDAGDASDTMRDILMVEAIATGFLAPSGEEPGEWMAAKAKGFAVELAAAGATGGATSLLKDTTGQGTAG